MAKQSVEENTRRYFILFTYLQQQIPDGYSMLDVIRAAEFLIADCIAESNVSPEVEERTFKSIEEDVRNFTKTFKKEIFNEKN